jgi:hypothetical protein
MSKNVYAKQVIKQRTFLVREKFSLIFKALAENIHYFYNTARYAYVSIIFAQPVLTIKPSKHFSSVPIIHVISTEHRAYFPISVNDYARQHPLLFILHVQCSQKGLGAPNARRVHNLLFTFVGTITFAPCG